MAKRNVVRVKILTVFPIDPADLVGLQAIAKKFDELKVKLKDLGAEDVEIDTQLVGVKAPDPS